MRDKASVARGRVIIGVVGAAALLLGGIVISFAPQPAAAKPEFAAQTGKPCGFCHQNPGGGGPLTGAGAKFKANGYKL
jgi:hypothetical protein